MNGTADKRKETLCPFLLSFIIEGLKMKKKIKWSTAVFLIIYLMILAYVCFFSEDYGRTEIQNIYQYNLIPFKEITRFYTYRELVGIEAFMLNLLGNVIAFIPFGFMKNKTRINALTNRDVYILLFIQISKAMHKTI